MASRRGLLRICNLCEKVYDEDRSLWVDVKEHRAYYDKLPNGLAFTGAFCEPCQKLYSVMLGRHNTSSHLNGSPVAPGISAASAPERPLEGVHGLA